MTTTAKIAFPMVIPGEAIAPNFSREISYRKKRRAEIELSIDGDLAAWVHDLAYRTKRSVSEVVEEALRTMRASRTETAA